MSKPDFISKEFEDVLRITKKAYRLYENSDISSIEETIYTGRKVWGSSGLQGMADSSIVEHLARLADWQQQKLNKVVEDYERLIADLEHELELSEAQVQLLKERLNGAS